MEPLHRYTVAIGDRTWTFHTPTTLRELWAFDLEVGGKRPPEGEEITPETHTALITALVGWVYRYATRSDRADPDAQVEVSELEKVAALIYEHALPDWETIGRFSAYFDVIELADEFDPSQVSDSLLPCECPKCLKIKPPESVDVPCKLDEHDTHTKAVANFYRLALEDPTWWGESPTAYAIARENRAAKALGFAARRQIEKGQDEEAGQNATDWDQKLRDNGINRDRVN